MENADWLSFLASLCKTFVWPIVVLVFLFKQQNAIEVLLRSIQSIKILGFEAKVKQILDNAEELVPAVGVGGQPENRDDSPVGRIKSSWYSVRRALWEAAVKSNMPSPNRLKPLTTLKWFEGKTIIDQETLETIRELRKLYDLAKSELGVVAVDSQQADRYEKLVAQVKVNLTK